MVTGNSISVTSRSASVFKHSFKRETLPVVTSNVDVHKKLNRLHRTKVETRNKDNQQRIQGDFPPT